MRRRKEIQIEENARLLNEANELGILSVSALDHTGSLATQNKLLEISINETKRLRTHLSKDEIAKKLSRPGR